MMRRRRSDPANALVDVFAAPLHQPVRDEHQSVPPVEPHRHGVATWANCGGALAAGTRSLEPLPERVEQRLCDFAELVAQALANADAHEQLAASRARIVEAGDAERRRLERNLHDGAQQRLVALAVDLTLIGAKLEKAPRAPAKRWMLRRTSSRKGLKS